ncbi:hypothetical protein NL676_030297 [Syzygium grande]|nr:hypothetical protein NL676_030297 [Syzygium grande]
MSFGFDFIQCYRKYSTYTDFYVETLRRVGVRFGGFIAKGGKGRSPPPGLEDGDLPSFIAGHACRKIEDLSLLALRPRLRLGVLRFGDTIVGEMDRMGGITGVEGNFLRTGRRSRWLERDWRMGHGLLRELLEKLCGVSTITIGHWCLQVLSTLEMEGVSSPLSKCQNLILRTPFGQFELPGIAYMLRSSQCLEKLVIHLTRFCVSKLKLDEESPKCAQLSKSFTKCRSYLRFSFGRGVL